MRCQLPEVCRVDIAGPQTRCGDCLGEAVIAVTVVKRRRSNTFNRHVLLSENRFRFRANALAAVKHLDP